MGAQAALPVLAKVAPFLLEGLGQIVGYKTKKEETEELGDFYKGLSAEGEESMADLEKSIAGFDLADPYKQLLRRAEEDPMGDIARRESQRGFGTTVGALEGAGAKSLLGGLIKTNQAFGDRDLGIAAQSFERLKDALSTTGQAQAAVDVRKFMADRADLASARKQALKYELAGIGADQQARRDKRDFLMGLVGTAGSMIGKGLFKGAESAGEGLGSGYNLNFKGGDPGTFSMSGPGYGLDFGEAETGRSIYFGEPEEGTYSNATEDLITPRSADVSGLTPFTPSQGAYSSLSQDPAIQRILRQLMMQGLMPIRGGYNPSMAEIEEFDLEFDKGGRTPGKFSHDTNEQYIVDKNGNYTGIAVTGNEVVIPPKDEKKIAKESPYFRRLLKQPRYQ